MTMSIRIRFHKSCQKPIGRLNIWLCKLNSDIVIQKVGKMLNVNGVVAEDALGAPVIHNEVSQYIDERSHGCI